MSLYLVKNLHEGSRPGNWIEYWEKKTGLKAINCHKIGCNALATDGAHVKLANGGNEWYIVPLCHTCNTGINDTFYVEGPLVPVNQDNKIRW